MLRSTNATLRAIQPTWRPSLSALRQQSTLAAAVVSEPVQAHEPAKPLSARGGSGRGKLLSDAASDPFSEFLKNVKRFNNTGDRRSSSNNKRDFKKSSAPGQFDDAVEEPKQQHKQRTPQRQQRSARPNNNYNNKNSRARSGNRSPQQQRADASARSSAPVIKNAPARRVTTFIDKDIDWNTMSGLNAEKKDAAADGTAAAATDADKAAIASGEYQPFLDVTKQVQWSQPINVEALSSLVGGNASYGLDQKTAFLSTLAAATGSSVSATPSQ
ncbi:hypothetical protein BX666DRAFT_1878836 [Dichotomocladium elegans]|nr:hypothetical protein BX666DRAFT_1878836 [Dichotomocladium elegans]